MAIVRTCYIANMQKKFMASSNFILVPRRYRYKKKWSINLKDTGDCQHALNNFDAFYKPYFGDQWPSIRVSLLSLQKYCAVVNKYGNSKQIASQLEDLEVSNFVDHVRRIQSKEMQQRMSASSGNTNLSQSLYQDTSSNSELTEATRELNNAIDDNPRLSSLTNTSTVEDQADENVYGDDNLNLFVPTEQVYSENQQLLREEMSINTFQPRDAGFEILPLDSLRISDDVDAFVFTRGDISMFPQPKAHDRIFGYYLMDAASIMPVIALDVQPNDHVLDLCAAPGGKTYTILQTLDPYAGGTLCCNDSSQSRLTRLRSVLYSYFPADVAGQVTITKSDGVMPPPTKYNKSLICTVKFCGWADFSRYVLVTENNRRGTAAQKVLVDAPCNSDRHVVTDNDNNLFKYSRTRERLELMETQKKLLISGIKACVPGGTIVYSTCTLSPAQNDGVIQAVLEELGGTSGIEVAIHDLSPLADMFRHVFKFYRKTRYGQLIIPTLMNNFGPSYFAKLRRVK